MKRWLLTLLTLLNPAVAFAAAYAFSAANYDSINGASTYTTAMHMQGTFTTAGPLAANLSNADLNTATGNDRLLNWNFNDGVYEYTPANSTLDGATGFVVSTDANGNPTFLSLAIASPSWPTSIGQAFRYIVVYTANGLSALDDDVCATIAGGACTMFAPGPNYSHAFAGGPGRPVHFILTRQADPTVSAPAGSVPGWCGLGLLLIVAAWRRAHAASSAADRATLRSAMVDQCAYRVSSARHAENAT